MPRLAAIRMPYFLWEMGNAPVMGIVIAGIGLVVALVSGAVTLGLTMPQPPPRPSEPRPAATATPVPTPAPTLTILPALPSALPPAASFSLPAGPLGPGAVGVEVRDLEERLSSLGYPVGLVDGIFDGPTEHAVVAFQKVEGLPRSGTADLETMARLASSFPPEAASAFPPDHLEVDLSRQVVLVVQGGQVTRILPTSTGSGKLFRSQGRTRRAVTPTGAFSITWKYPKWRKSPLGWLYKPSYFNGGIAFHGYRSVPTEPASHGCVRLPMHVADWFFNEVAHKGTTVYVYNNPSEVLSFPPPPGSPV